LISGSADIQLINKQKIFFNIDARVELKNVKIWYPAKIHNFFTKIKIYPYSVDKRKVNILISWISQKSDIRPTLVYTLVHMWPNLISYAIPVIFLMNFMM
jgi:hypothetical protein